MNEKPELKECDLIMQGGLTSGVVYPNAIVKLSSSYRFRNIGGASAGAIAAGAAAAAEYRRQNCPEDDAAQTMAGIAALPNEFSDGVLKYFQPDAKFRRLFGVLTDALDGKGKSSVLFSLLRRYAVDRVKLPTATVLLVAVLLVIALFIHSDDLPLAAVAGTTIGILGLVILGLVLVFGIGISRAVSALAADIGKIGPETSFGVCSGRTVHGQPPNSGLTDWLYGLFQSLAGRTINDPPLTFQDLKNKGIDLTVISTCLSQGRPHRLPMNTAIFWFEPNELSEFFPPQVIAHMTSLAADRTQILNNAVFYPFPGNHAEANKADTAFDLPIIVAIRMSLSFPLLFKAVPLYMIDRSAKARASEEERDESHKPIRHFEQNGKAGVETPMLKCWFSDGGISSNFPIHFFDSYLPQRPTFGIALGEITKEQEEAGEKTAVWRPIKAGQGQLSSWSELRGLGGFLGSVLGSAKDWQDNMLSEIAGYRERIVTVNLKPGEGGINLSMDGRKIASLSDLGRQAGENLLQFDFDEHRWRRFLVAQDRLQALIDQVSASWQHTEPFIRAYEPKSYKRNLPADVKSVSDRIDEITAIPTGADDWPRLAVPKPECVMRIAPKE